jgi:hypothetical protein
MHLPFAETHYRRHFRNVLWPLIIAGWIVFFWPAVANAWSLVVEQGKIGTTLPDIRTGSWEVTGSQADVLPSINATGESAVIGFSPTSMVVTERLAFIDEDQGVVLEDLRTNLSDLTLTLDYGAPGGWPEWVAVEGEVEVDATRIEHPLLVSQAWNFQGRVEGPLANLRVQGVLASGAGLKLDLDIQINPGGAVSISVDSLIEGEKGVRALAETFAGWPTLLTVDSGNADVSAEFLIGPEGGLGMKGGVSLEGVSGVFDRTAFSGLRGDVLASLEGDLLTAGFRDLAVEQVNPGISVSSIRFTGDYTAPVAILLEGQLDIQEAEARFLEGMLRIPSGFYDLREGSGSVPVEMQDLSLARLMEVYPAEGLGGSGLLSGRIPVSLSRDGVQVLEGRVSAEAPGGRLQLPADKLQAMLGNNQAMNLVVQALQNFHYSVLSSTIDYDKTGKLTLGLRIEGDNPDVRGGQPVVLNLNLEDDIPALLTSLQLSGRVNEAVTERVRELLQQSGQETVP